MNNQQAMIYLGSNMGKVVSRLSNRASRRGEVATYYRLNDRLGRLETARGIDGVPNASTEWTTIRSTSRLFRNDLGYQYEALEADSGSTPADGVAALLAALRAGDTVAVCNILTE